MATPVWGTAGTDETGGIEPFFTTSGAISSSTDRARTGGRSFKCVSGVAGAAAWGSAVVGADAGRRWHTALWMVDLPSAFNSFLSVANIIVQEVFQVGVSSAGVLQVYWNSTVQKSGSTLSTGAWREIVVSYKLTSTTNFTIKVYLDNVLDITVTNADASLVRVGSSYHFQGWNAASVGNSKTWYLDDLWVDDATDLSSPGLLRVVSKLPTTVNNNQFDTTGGTGAVNERPISITNYKQHAADAGGAVHQDYAIEAPDVGDFDVNRGTILGHIAWIWAKQGAGTAGAPKIVDAGSDFAVTLTTSPALYTHVSSSTAYPTQVNAIGMASGGNTADAFLYECGILIAVVMPDPPTTKAPPPMQKRWRYSDARKVA